MDGSVRNSCQFEEGIRKIIHYRYYNENEDKCAKKRLEVFEGVGVNKKIISGNNKG